MYKLIIPAGTYKTSSIKIAEAAKIIENTQRDLNIALINELSMIFNKMNLDTEEILKAAETKWNFNSYRPGLVGGHCISVDPYYLTYKAKQIGLDPKIILAGRETNDYMPIHVSKNLVSYMEDKGFEIKNSKILIMGFTFKENCNDLRNTQVTAIFNYLKNICNVDIYDPLVDYTTAQQSLNCNFIKEPLKGYYDAIIIAVAHNIFKEMGSKKNQRFWERKCDYLRLEVYLFKEKSLI